MTMPRTTPATALSMSALLGTLLVVWLLLAATQRPWLGIDFGADASAGSVRVDRVDPTGPAAFVPEASVVLALEGAAGQRIALVPGDLVEDPDGAESYAQLRAFFARQDALAGMLDAGTVTLVLAGGERIAVAPAPQRPLQDLPPVFWVQVFVGIVSFLVGIWVWSLRPRASGTALLAGIGASILVFSFAAALYSTRELALDGGLFRVLAALNHLGALAFGVAMTVLFLVYPKPIAPTWFIATLFALAGSFWFASTVQLGFLKPQFVHLAITLEMVGIVIAVTLQYLKTRGDVLARATLRWFALSVTVGAGAFVLMVVTPQLFGIAPAISQGYGFLLFLLIHVGVALGVARYRLFALEGWAFRVLFYLSGVMLLLLLDAALAWSLVLDRTAAFAASLSLVALLYLPLRDWLARRVLRKSKRQPLLFHRVIDVALAPLATEANATWRALLQDAFAPLGMGVGEPVPEAEIGAEGVVLSLPGNGPIAPLHLEHADGGRKLFTPGDLRVARELCTMLGHALSSRDAYERGAAEERARVTRDIHDNIGAQLLSALHSGEPERKNALIRETITDIRGIINNAAGGHQCLDEALAELRLEASQRLALSGIELAWQMDPLDAGAVRGPQLIHGLRSILREGLSNAIRHSGATRVTITASCRNDRLALAIADNGKGLDAAATLGNGLANMRTRAIALKGSLAMTDNAPGLRLLVEVPI